MTTRRSTIISRQTPTASWSTVLRRFTDSHRLKAIRTMVIKGRTRVSRSKAFTPFWPAARSLDLTRVIWPKLLGSVTPRALDSLVTVCWGGSTLVMEGRVTGLPVKSEARPDTFARAWLTRGTVLMTMYPPEVETAAVPWPRSTATSWWWVEVSAAVQMAWNWADVSTFVSSPATKPLVALVTGTAAKLALGGSASRSRAWTWSSVNSSSVARAVTAEATAGSWKTGATVPTNVPVLSRVRCAHTSVVDSSTSRQDSA